MPEARAWHGSSRSHHGGWPTRLLAAPTVLGVADPYGVELIHPMREGRSPAQSGKISLNNHTIDYYPREYLNSGFLLVQQVAHYQALIGLL